MMPARTVEGIMTGNPGKTVCFRGGHKEDDVFNVAHRALFFKRDSGKKAKKQPESGFFQQMAHGKDRLAKHRDFFGNTPKKTAFRG